MSESAFKIRHGEFYDVEGPARRYQDVSIVPARVNLKGTSFQMVFELADCLSNATATAKAIVHPGDDAPWVLGRLMRIFGTPLVPEEERGEKTCSSASFLAVLHAHDNLAIPFECTDRYGQSGLMFSTDDLPDLALQQIIADAFWGLLLSEPTDLVDFTGRLFHSGAGIWIRFGVDQGEPFMIEDSEE